MSFFSKDTYKNVKYVEAMGLVLIRPDGGADKMEPFIRFLRAHHTLHYSSLEVHCHFLFKTGRGMYTVQTSTGRGSKQRCQPAQKIKIVFCTNIVYILSQPILLSCFPYQIGDHGGGF